MAAKSNKGRKIGRDLKKCAAYRAAGKREKNRKRRAKSYKHHLQAAKERRERNHPNYAFEKRAARYEKNHPGMKYTQEMFLQA